MDYLELIKAREEAEGKLKKDYLELIEKAREWTKNKGADPEHIIEIKVHITYSDNIRGYSYSAGNLETIYIKEGARDLIWSEDKLMLGKSVEVNKTHYHLEILVPRP